MKSLNKKKSTEPSVLSYDAWVLLKSQSGLVETSKVKKLNLSHVLSHLPVSEKAAFVDLVFSDAVMLATMNDLHNEVILDNLMQYCSEKHDVLVLDLFIKKVLSLKIPKDINRVCTYLLSICDRSFTPLTKRDSGLGALYCLSGLVVNPSLEPTFKKNVMYQILSRSNINSTAVRITLLDILHEVGKYEDVSPYQNRIIQRFGQSFLETLIGMWEDKKLTYYCETILQKSFSTFYATSEETAKITYDLFRNHMLRYPEVVPSVLMKYVQNIEKNDNLAYSFLWLSNHLLFSALDLSQKALVESLFRIHLKLFAQFPHLTQDLSSKTLSLLNARFSNSSSFLLTDIKKKMEMIHSGGLNPKKFTFLKDEGKTQKLPQFNLLECLVIAESYGR